MKNLTTTILAILIIVILGLTLHYPLKWEQTETRQGWNKEYGGYWAEPNVRPTDTVEAGILKVLVLSVMEPETRFLGSKIKSEYTFKLIK